MADTYKWIVLNRVIKRLSDGASIPNDLGNLDWKKYLSDVAGGATVTAADPAPTPAVVLADEVAGAVDQFLNSTSSISKIERSAALVTMDEVNILRQWIMSFKSAVNLATTLADLKTRVAALSDTPDRVGAQIRTAIQNKLTSGGGN